MVCKRRDGLKVGVFDSGVGGLTVLRALRETLPNVDLIYLGDTARVPYGVRSRETVVRYSLECAEFLTSQGIDALVVACNTASSYAVDVLSRSLDIPVVGVVDPGVKSAVKVSKGKVGVIGTSATINSGSYQRSLEKHGLKVFSRACPLFVPLVEEGILEGEVVDRVVDMYLRDLKEQGVDTLILGCTHYPLLKEPIQKSMGDVNIVDSSEAVAEVLRSIVPNEGSGGLELFFTDRSQNLNRLIEIAFGDRVEPNIIQEGVGKF